MTPILPVLAAPSAWPARSYLDWAERYGEATALTESGLWHAVANRVWEAFPFRAPLAPSDDEIRNLLQRRRFAAMRFPVTLDSPGFDSVRYIFRGSDYGFPVLGQKARNQTRRGLETYEVRSLGLLELRDGGWEAYRETLARQHRRLPPQAQRRWLRYCTEAASTPGFGAWAAFREGHLAAFIVAFRAEDCWHVMLLRSRLQELSRYPNNALVFTATQSMLAQPGVTEVSFGWSSLRQDLASLEHFKLGMGFRAVPVRQRVILHPVLEWCRRAFRPARWLPALLRTRNQEAGAKMEGMLAAVAAGRALPPPTSGAATDGKVEGKK